MKSSAEKLALSHIGQANFLVPNQTRLNNNLLDIYSFLTDFLNNFVRVFLS